MYGALLLVQSYLPHPQFTHNAHTHTSEPKGFYYCMPWTLSTSKFVLLLQPPKFTQTKTQTSMHTAHTPAPRSSHQHGFSYRYMCRLCCMSGPLPPPPAHTACWSCCDSGNKLVWSCSSAWRGDSTYHMSPLCSLALGVPGGAKSLPFTPAEKILET